MQSAYLHFKHPNILRTSDELLLLNFFLESIIGCQEKIDLERSS